VSSQLTQRSTWSGVALSAKSGARVPAPRIAGFVWGLRAVSFLPPLEPFSHYRASEDATLLNLVALSS